MIRLLAIALVLGLTLGCTGMITREGLFVSVGQGEIGDHCNGDVCKQRLRSDGLSAGATTLAQKALAVAVDVASRLPFIGTFVSKPDPAPAPAAAAAPTAVIEFRFPDQDHPPNAEGGGGVTLEHTVDPPVFWITEDTGSGVVDL